MVIRFSFSFELCLATMGVCVFQCADNRWRTFLFVKKENSDGIGKAEFISYGKLQTPKKFKPVKKLSRHARVGTIQFVDKP